MVLVTKPPRDLLRYLLAKQLKAEQPSKHLQCLRQALEGLHALEYGEVHPILTPKKTKDKGATPYSAKKFRMIAVGFVDLLRKKGSLKRKARANVAKAYNVSVHTIDDWQKDPGKTPDPWM